MNDSLTALRGCHEIMTTFGFFAMGNIGKGEKGVRGDKAAMMLVLVLVYTLLLGGVKMPNC